MANYTHHLYMIVFPVNALVASQLDPYQFANHYTIGSAKHFSGKVIFAEIDINYRNQYFNIDNYLDQTIAHPDGSPKKTKYICSYKVLEYIDFKAIQNLYIVTANGKALELESKPYTAINEPGLVRIYQEITPLTNLVASTFDQRDFGKYITSITRSKGCPKLFFTQYDLNVAEFMSKHRESLYSPIPESNPARLYDFLIELQNTPEKKTKTINLSSTLKDASFLLIRHGFWFIAGDELLFYPIPTEKELEREHYEWYKYI